MENVIHFLQNRGFLSAVTKGACEAVEERVKVYIGFDPTAPSLHLGNLVGVVALEWFRRFGHTPIVLLGGGTGKIGDPSGKSKERPLLDFTLLEEHANRIRRQFVGYFGEKILIFDNDAWLSSMNLLAFLRDVGKYFRLGVMLGKESVRARLHSAEGMSFAEFVYQVLQGYDFYHLFKEEGVTFQMGGDDQWGNITSGVELTRKLAGKRVHGLTYPLLLRSDGSKFGKSEGGAIWLDPDRTSPYRLYQYLLGVADGDVAQLMRMLTFMDLAEILDLEREIASGNFTPHAAQRRLAEEVTRFVHGEPGLTAALRMTEEIGLSAQKEVDSLAIERVAGDMPHIFLRKEEVLGKKYLDTAVKSKLFASKGEVVRLMRNGGAYLNNKRVEDRELLIRSEHLIGGRYLLIGRGKRERVLIDIAR